MVDEHRVEDRSDHAGSEARFADMLSEPEFTIELNV